jgi:hypothetical protein
MLHYVGGGGGGSNERLALLAKNTPGLVRLECYPNVDVASEVPSGVVLFMDPNARVDPSLISNELFQVLCVSRVRGSADDARFERADIGAAVPQFSAHPPSAAADTQAWDAELGGRDAFVGAYFQLRPDHRTKDYYIAARGTAPLVVQDLKRRLSVLPEAERPTYGELVGDSQWSAALRNGAHMAQRNVRRAVATLADACGVQVRVCSDVSAHTVDEHYAPPDRAEPEWEQPLHSIASVIVDGRPLVALYNGVAPREHCQLLGDGRFFVCGNPSEGISVFQLASAAAPATNALPVDTGKQQQQQQQQSHAIASGLVWEGAEAPAYAYQSATDKRFLRCMKECGWDAEEHVQKLVPVAAKLYNPNVRRVK